MATMTLLFCRCRHPPAAPSVGPGETEDVPLQSSCFQLSTFLFSFQLRCREFPLFPRTGRLSEAKCVTKWHTFIKVMMNRTEVRNSSQRGSTTRSDRSQQQWVSGSGVTCHENLSAADNAAFKSILMDPDRSGISRCCGICLVCLSVSR